MFISRDTTFVALSRFSRLHQNTATRLGGAVWEG